MDVKFVKINSFDDLKDIWHSLEKGIDMTPFQSFSWYSELNAQYANKGRTIPGKPIYAIAYIGDKAVMIAPLYIVKLPKIARKFHLDSGAYILGKWGHSDYLNFIYDEFSKVAFDSIILSVKNKYKINHVFMHQIIPNSKISEYINSEYSNSLSFEGECVKIIPNETFEEYHQHLSKNFRQNIRTANNRAKKDGNEITYKLEKHISEKKAKQLYKIYIERRAVKNASDKDSLLYRISDFLSQRSMKKYNYIVHAMQHLDNTFIQVFYVNEEIAGFCFGLEDDKAIYLPIVCVTEKYAKYSPGIVCIYDFLKDSYENGSIKVFDLLKGSEKYKKSFGGTASYIGYYDITV